MDVNNMHRRGVVAGLALLGVAPGLANAKGPAPVVATANGKVQGFTADNGVATYRGIHYGGTTAGANRFMPPTPPPPWTGVREALEYGPTAPQPGRPPGQPGASGPQPARTTPPMNEDCLVLNVWTPEAKAGAKKAVMVWLHGGGFSGGSASGALSDGTNLARVGDVVVVGVNHRLNIFGYTFLGRIGGPAFADSGNVGQLDIVQALKWVHDNIAAFGGDPGRVTIFGQSGGGQKVTTLLAMPKTKGLITRAIAESGPGMFMAKADEQDQAAQEVIKELGLAKGDVKALQAVPQDALLKAYGEVNRRHPVPGPGFIGVFAPTVDGRSLPHDPFDPKAPAVSANVPLIIGYTHTESTGFRHDPPQGPNMTDADIAPSLKSLLGDKAPEMVAAYRKALPNASAWDITLYITTDYPTAGLTREIARRKNAAGPAPAYLYRWDWETKVNGMRAFHTIEVPFVFSNTAAMRGQLGEGPDLAPLSEKMSLMWSNFAKTGKPSAPGWPAWPPYDSKTRPTMMINSTPTLVNDPDRALRIADDKAIGLWPIV